MLSTKVDSEVQEMMAARFADIIEHLKELGYKKEEIRKAIKIASEKILVELSKDNQRQKKEAKKKAQL